MPLRLTSLALFGFVSSVSAQGTDSKIDFNRDIRPILADRCFACHGPDAKARKAKLRLDTRHGALVARRAGRVIVPGDAKASLLVRRIRHADLGERMPPPKSGKTLDEREVELLERWIDAGAEWQSHWAYERLERPRVPAAREAAWGSNAIDRFLDARLRRIGLEPSPRADARTLVRRLYFDVLGIPPPPEVVDGFAKAPSDAAWAKLVDRVLESPHHAERLAMYWLDLVRYADSCGIHGDQDISMSPYRDWVIRSFQDNKPFDEFTREQIAGDLLPNATLQQRIASGYNRLNPKTAEGGAQDKEYLAKYAADRVRTTATTWLGSTLGCAECHDHKFDPFTMTDFYSFAAYFADLEQKGYYGGANSTGNWGPRVSVPNAEQAAELARLDSKIASLERGYAKTTPALASARRAWEAKTLGELAKRKAPKAGPWRSVGPFTAADVRRAHDAAFGPEKDSSADQSYGKRLAWRPRPNWVDGKIHKLSGSNCATYLHRVIESDSEQSVQLSIGSDDSIKLWLNGELVVDKYVLRGVKAGQEKPRISLRPGRNEVLMKICNGGGGYGFYFAIGRVGPPAAIAKILTVDASARSAAQRQSIDAHHRSITPLLADVRGRLREAKLQRAGVEKQLTTSLVSLARKTPRTTRVLARGDWQDESGQVVEPGTPAFLGAGPTRAGRQTRLDLAAWLTSRDNPLTARVFVNRLWKLYFGHGLSRTLDDLGSQGQRPQHRELLDWLAAEFIEGGWDIRAMIRLLLNSEAYRQSSRASEALASRDPENREFARQTRYRHDAEVIRDNALEISGLLVRDRIGGPSVKPYQPAGYWSQLNFPKRRWTHHTDSRQHRRGLYVHWQRTFLHPSLVAFDAPPREACTAERARSNTPLQALVLLNDPSFVEAARALAARVLREGGQTQDERLRWLFGRALSRAPTPREAKSLRRFVDERRAHYASRPDAAGQVTSIGIAAKATDLDVVEHAAWTAVARAVLNLYETNTRY